MLSLKTMGTRINTSEIEFRGEKVKVRGLSAADRTRLDELHLPPVPPMGRDPRLGDGAPVEDLPQDPEHRRKVREHVARLMALELAIALDWATHDGATWDTVKKDTDKAIGWSRAVVAEVGEAGISGAEVDLVLAAAGRLEV